MAERVRGAALAAVVLLLAAAWAPGDIIHLKKGKVEGTVVERTATHVVVQTKVGRISLNAADVVRIERKATPLSLYREQAARVDPKDAAGHFALGLWCTEQKLFREARQEFEKTLAIEADHAGARAKLGYVRKDGRWMTRAEAKRADGYVLHDGRWVKADELERATRRRSALLLERKLRKAIGTKGAGVERFAARIAAALGPDRNDDSEHALRAVLSDLAKAALADKRDRLDEARIALVATLGQEPSTETNDLLQRIGIRDRDGLVRAAAVQALATQDSVDNTAYFVGLLRKYTGERYRIRGDKKTRTLARRVLRRSAIALAGLDDRRAIPALARSLVVRFHIAEQTDEIPPMTLGFATPRFAGGSVVTDSQGNQLFLPAREENNWGLAGDDDVKPLEDGFFFNEAAYAALRKLTGRDFSLDKRAWLGWWYRNRHNLVN